MHGMKDKKKKIILLAILVVIAATVGIYFLIKYQTYNYVEITTVYENNNTYTGYLFCMYAIFIDNENKNNKYLERIMR